MTNDRYENNTPNANVADKAAKEAMTAMNDIRAGEFGDAARNAMDAAVDGAQGVGQMAADAVETVTQPLQNYPTKDPADLPGE